MHALRASLVLCAALSLAACKPGPVPDVPEHVHGVEGQALAAAFQATGGAPPYAWTVAGGALPAGVQLATDGVLSGAPAAAGSYPLVVQVSDQTGASATSTTALVVQDPQASGSWDVVGSLDTPQAGVAVSAEPAPSGGFLLVGGLDASGGDTAAVRRFDLGGSVGILPYATIQPARWLAAAVTEPFGYTILLGGRAGTTGFAHSSVAQLSPGGFSVAQRPALPEGRCMMGAALIPSDGIYTFGGATFDASGAPVSHDEIWRLDLSSGGVAWTWSLVGHLPRAAHGVLAVSDGATGTIYLFGGVSADPSGSTWLDDVYAFDGASLSARAPLARPTAHLAGGWIQGRIYLASGSHGDDPSERASAEGWCYDPARDVFQALPPLTGAGSQVAARTLAGGAASGDRLYLFGGRRGDGAPLREVLEYRP